MSEPFNETELRSLQQRDSRALDRWGDTHHLKDLGTKDDW